MLAPLGWLLGLLAFPFLGERRRVIKRNLELCFPERSPAWLLRTRMLHHALLGRFLLDHALLLAASPERLRRLVRVRGLEHLEALQGRPAIVLAPHFLGLDQGCARLALEHPLAGLYAPQHSSVANDLVVRARQAAGPGRLEAIDNTQRGALRLLLRKIREERRWLYYLNDFDYRDYSKSVFVPFMGVAETATLASLPRLVRRLQAPVVFCVTTALPWGGYEVKLSEPWEGFPGEDETADMAAFNAKVGAMVAEHPAQYYWPHRRFKTRPHGAANLYDD